MNQAVETRPFKTSDTESLTRLWDTVLPASHPRNESRAVLCKKLNQLDSLIFVAARDEEIVGAVVAGYDGVRGWIYRLAVSPNARRRGIGSELVRTAEQALIELGCPKVNLQVVTSNKDVVGFYERCGYDVEPRLSLGKPLTAPTGDHIPTIPISDEVTLSRISLEDREAYLKYLNQTDEFQLHTGTMPHPYTELDADQWLSKVCRASLSRDRAIHWAIRRADGELIGSIGLMDMTEGERAEVGYWLAKPYWGHGWMTASVVRVCATGFERYGLKRIHARVFATNPTSARVLEKAGFDHEGTQRDHYFRDGKPMDVLLYGLLRPAPES